MKTATKNLFEAQRVETQHHESAEVIASCPE
jgi:hypothetical protein